MYIEMMGKRGQGDKRIETSILNNLYYNSSLCIVLEEYGFSMCQDDTIVDLRTNFEIFSPIESCDFILEDIKENLDNYFINIFNTLFTKKGLVVINIMVPEISQEFHKRLKEFYFNNLNADKNNKIHFVYVKLAE